MAAAKGKGKGRKAAGDSGAAAKVKKVTTPKKAAAGKVAKKGAGKKAAKKTAKKAVKKAAKKK